MVKPRRKTKTIWLAAGAVIICALVVAVMICTRLPDISADTTVPVILEVRGQNRQYLLAAWEPEKATLEIGRRSIGTAATQEENGQNFTRLSGSGKLLWWSGDTSATTVEKILRLKSWNKNILMPLTSYPVSPTAGWWWSGRDTSVTTLHIEYGTTKTSPLLPVIPLRLIISDMSGKMCSVDFSPGFASRVVISILAAHGDLQDGFVLLQWTDEKTGQEYLSLVRLQNGAARTDVVARDSHYDPKNGSTWLYELSRDPPKWAYVGTTLYLHPRVDNAKVDYLWTLDTNTSVPTLRRDEALADLGISGSYPMACEPYLLLHDHNGDVVAIRDGRLVGRLHISGTTVSTVAGTRSVTRRIRNLYQVHLPNAADLSYLWLSG
jgi:hypothetical protein